MDPGRKYDDGFEPQPKELYCQRNGVHKTVKFLRNVVYWHRSSICKECTNKPICENKEENR